MMEVCGKMTDNKNALVFGDSHDVCSVEIASGKDAYEKPTLTVVNFMFESDITWGSFDDNESHEGEDEISVEDSWWD